MGEKGGPDDQRGRLIGRTKGGLNTKLHAVTDAKGRLRQVNTVSGISGTFTYTVWQERAVLDALARDLAWQVMV